MGLAELVFDILELKTNMNGAFLGYCIAIVTKNGKNKSQLVEQWLGFCFIPLL